MPNLTILFDWLADWPVWTGYAATATAAAVLTFVVSWWLLRNASDRVVAEAVDGQLTVAQRRVLAVIAPIGLVMGAYAVRLSFNSQLDRLTPLFPGTHDEARSSAISAIVLIDGSILLFGAVSLWLVWTSTRIWWARLPSWFFIALTIAMNISAAPDGEDLVETAQAIGAHIAGPVVWALIVELALAIIAVRAKIADPSSITLKWGFAWITNARVAVPATLAWINWPQLREGLEATQANAIKHLDRVRQYKLDHRGSIPRILPFLPFARIAAAQAWFAEHQQQLAQQKATLDAEAAQARESARAEAREIADAARQELDAEREARAVDQDRIVKLTADLQSTERQLTEVRERVSVAGGSAKEKAAEIISLRDQVRALTGELAAFSREKAQVDAVLTRESARADAAERALSTERESARQRVEIAARVAQDRIDDLVRQLDAARTNASGEAQRAYARVRDLEQQLTTAVKDCGEAIAKLGRAEASAEQATRETAAIHRTAAELRAELAKTRDLAVSESERANTELAARIAAETALREARAAGTGTGSAGGTRTGTRTANRPVSGAGTGAHRTAAETGTDPNGQPGSRVGTDETTKAALERAFGELVDRGFDPTGADLDRYLAIDTSQTGQARKVCRAIKEQLAAATGTGTADLGDGAQ